MIHSLIYNHYIFYPNLIIYLIYSNAQEEEEDGEEEEEEEEEETKVPEKQKSAPKQSEETEAMRAQKELILKQMRE